MTKGLLVVALLGASVPAFAEGAPPAAPVPMKAVPAGNTACSLMTHHDEPAACKITSSEKVDGLGKVSLMGAGTVRTGASFALSIESGGKTYVTDSIVLSDDCGMGKCTSPASASARLRVIAKKYAALAIEVKMTFSGGNEGGGKKTSESWKEYRFLICKPSATGAPTCSTRQFGGRGAACTASLADDGTLTHACPETEFFGGK